MSLLTQHRPVDAALRALDDSAKITRVLRTRLERCDAKRFHLHRTLMRLRFALDNAVSPAAFMDEAQRLLSESGYSSLEREKAA